MLSLLYETPTSTWHTVTQSADGRPCELHQLTGLRLTTDTHRWVKQQLTVGMGESLRQPITTTPYHCRVTVETCDTERPTGQLRLTKILATPLESLRQIVRQEICNWRPCTSHICDICKAFIKSWEILDPLILRQNYINCIHLYPTYHFLPSLC